jgi:Zn-finger nucleic acid-binding protein
MSNCPNCGELSQLEPHLEGTPPLSCSSCRRCGGIWITAAAYADWLERLADSKPAVNANADDFELKEGPFLRRCPDCSYVLGRYRVSAELPFTIERCHNCRGVWLDQHEWDLLKSHELHQRLHAIFDAEWQNEVRQQSQRQREEARRREVLGEADHARILETRNWLESHAQRDLLWSMLLESPGSKGA